MSKKTEKMNINPNVLKILRENAGYIDDDGIDELAKKLGVSKDKIISVENGDDRFTLRQIEKLSQIYKMPLAIFFSDSVPHIPKLPDYRLHRDRKLSRKVYLAIRRAKYLVDMVYEISGKRSIIPSFGSELTPKELALRLKEYLRPLHPTGHPSKILDYYKRLIEEKLNIIVIEYPLEKMDVGGFTICSNLAVIVLNESDKATVKIFSLFHELGHLLHGESGICSITMEESIDREKYCNRFAAEFLMPEPDVKAIVNRYGTDNDALKRMHKRFGVSMHAIMIRLLNLGLISRERYDEFRKSFDKRPEESVRMRHWETTYRNRVGHLVLEEVNKAYKNGDISFWEAMSILDLKMKYAEKLLG